MSAEAEQRRPSWWPADFDEWPQERRDALLGAMHQNTPKARVRYCPFLPTPKQNAFLLRDEIEAFYGGAAGPGKSTALLMGALQYADVPGYAALLLRQTYQELALPGALMPMAGEWLHGTGASYKGIEHTWTFPSTATLTFGYLQHSDDKYRYKGSQFAYIGFDELTEFDEEDYEYLFSRLRKPYSTAPSLVDGTTLDDLPLRMRGASNPGGPGHDWVQERFVDDETREPGRVFIPALLQENPHLDREAYTRSLMNLRGPELDRLLRGDWGALDVGDVFHPEQITLTEDWSRTIAAIRYWDLAATEPHDGNRDPDYTTGTKLELGENGVITITDIVHGRWNPGAVERVVQNTAMLDGYSIPVYIEQDPGQAGKAQVANYARLLPGFIIRAGHTKNLDKRTRSVGAAAAFENHVLQMNSAMTNLRTALLELRRFPNRGAHDDIVDTITGGYTHLTQGGVQTHTSAASVAEGGQGGVPAAADMPRTPGSVAEMMAKRVNRT